MENKKKMVPSVAILMSTYNGEKFLDEQLRSIYEQTFSSITLIVRDDGSVDATQEILKKWTDLIHVVQIPPTSNLGPAQSFMLLAENCGNYDYYAFCDQDDVWDADKIETAVHKLEGMSIPALYFSRSRSINSEGNLLSEDRILKPEYLTVESELTCGFCPGCAMVFNNELMKIVRKQHYRNIPMHDMVFIMTAFAVGKVIYDEDIHFSRRMHGGNVVGREGKNRLQKITQSYKRWIKDSKDNPYDEFVADFIDNTKDMNPAYDISEMNAFANYKKSFAIKKRIITSKRFVIDCRRGMRSFKARIILNLL